MTVVAIAVVYLRRRQLSSLPGPALRSITAVGKPKRSIFSQIAAICMTRHLVRPCVHLFVFKRSARSSGTVESEVGGGSEPCVDKSAKCRTAAYHDFGISAVPSTILCRFSPSTRRAKSTRTKR